MKREKLAAVFFAVVIVLGLAGSAGAVDGTIDINQAKVLAAGGFPFAISASGSYRLTSNLSVPSSTNGINVNSTNVTIDLNGFSITGGGVAPFGIVVTVGIIGPTVVENGTVTGFSGSGVFMRDNSTVRNVHSDGSNGNAGIVVGANSVIEDCTTNSSQGNGMLAGDNSVIEGGTANSNQGSGIISGANSRIRRSTADNNVITGISAGQNSVIEGCTANGSTQVSSSPNLGSGIVCDGGCAISGNSANGNADDGIVCFGNGCVISGNTADANTSNAGLYCDGDGCLISGNTAFNNKFGIFVNDGTTGYGGNVLENTTNHVSGTSLGNNLCSGTVC